MVNMEYHKGSFCVYTSVFCQEEYCSGCEIYKKRPVATKHIGRPEVVKSLKAPQPVLKH